MPWFSCALQAAGGVLALDASRFASSLFPYSTVVDARALIDSLDAISAFEAAVVDDHTRDWVVRRIGGLDLHTGDLIMYIS